MLDFLDAIPAQLAELATPANIALTASAALSVVLMAVCARLVKARRRGRQAAAALAPSEPRTPVPWANRLTYASALMASAIAAQGMFMWLKDVLGFHPLAAFLACAFVELAMLVSALRARDNLQKPPYSTGPDGKAVWVFAVLSGVLSASHAASVSEAFGRLAVTMVAGWLWERSLQVERRALTGKTSSIRWSVTPTRLLIRLGLADPTTRDTDEIARERRIAEYVRAIHALSDAESLSDPKAISKARKRWERAYSRAVEYARVDVDPAAAELVARKVDAVRERRTLVERIESAPTPPVAELPPAPRKSIAMRRVVAIAAPDSHPTQSDAPAVESAPATRPVDPTQSAADADRTTRLLPTDPDPVEMARALLETRTDPTDRPDREPVRWADLVPTVYPTQSAPAVVFAAPPALPDCEPTDDDDPTQDPTDRPDSAPVLSLVRQTRPTVRRAQSGTATTARRSLDEHRETVRLLVARGVLASDAPAEAIRTTVGCSAANARTLRDELRQVAP